MNNSIFCPSLYIQGEDEQSSKIALKLTKAKDRFVVRITGGCGYMNQEDASGLNELFEKSFEGFSGAMLFGGTRMIKKGSQNEIVPSITEIAPLVRKKNNNSVVLGVVPKTDDLYLSEYGLIVCSEESSDYVTIIHPEQDICLMVQKSVDQNSLWEAEYKECIKIIDSLRKYADWKSLLISYNGGGVTEKEILKTAELGWPVLLIKNSGRKTDEYAENKRFLERYPNVLVCEKNYRAIRNVLKKIGAIPSELKKEIFHTKLFAINGGSQ